MEFFNITKFGFRETFKPHMKEYYIERPNIKKPVDTAVDGDYDGYGYGSHYRLKRSLSKGLYKPVGPTDMYKRPITSSMSYGFWINDPALKATKWFVKTKDYSRFYTPKARFYQYALSLNKDYHD